MTNNMDKADIAEHIERINLSFILFINQLPKKRPLINKPMSPNESINDAPRLLICGMASVT